MPEFVFWSLLVAATIFLFPAIAGVFLFAAAAFSLLIVFLVGVFVYSVAYLWEKTVILIRIVYPWLR
jgi:hypothetical protein